MMAKRNPVVAAYYRADPPNEYPPAVGAAEGQSNAVGANAESSYSEGPAAGKDDGIFGSLKDGSPSALKKAHLGSANGSSRSKGAIVGFRAETGREWRYNGKRGRVLQMLATMPEGVTPWDCWPWHTRLGASVHVLREDGLQIYTEREGEYRHARYRLRTPGCLIIQAENNGEPVDQHREAP